VDSKVSKTLADRYGVKESDLFNLSVRDRKTDTAEYFPNVAIAPSLHRLDQVLENESELVRVAGELGRVRSGPHPSPESGKNWWEDSKASSATDGQATDGEALTSAEFKGDEAKKEGICALEHADIFNLLCIPPYKEGDEDVDTDVPAAAATYCEKRRAMLLIDPPNDWSNKDKAKEKFPIDGLSSNNAAIFFPRIQVPNPLRDNQVEAFAPGLAHRSPGQTEYSAITLERGVTHDADFEKWANKVWTYGNAAGQEVSLRASNTMTSIGSSNK
jgi:hypothetical protein